MNASQVRALVRKAQLAVLGSLGAGAAGGVTNNASSELNPSFVAAGATPTFTSVAHTGRTGKVFVTAQATVSNTHTGTLAAGDSVVFQLLIDSNPMGGTAEVGAVAATGETVGASATLSWIDFESPGETHTYSIKATIGNSHTAAIDANMAQIVVMDV
jgi:hypothetical protein